MLIFNSLLGLWQICFNNYEDFKYMYDRVYDGCYWTLDEVMHVRADQMYARKYLFFN